jgi:alpha-glucosidase
MKRTIGKFHEANCVKNENFSIEVKADNGKLLATIYSEKLIYLRYEPEGLEVPRALEEASSLLAGSPPAEKGVTVEQGGDEGSFTFLIKNNENTTTLMLDRANGNISVLYKGALVHGGRLGSGDTVIPQAQFRAFTGSGLPRCRFNFPLEGDDGFFGLGDKGGRPDRRGRRLRMFNKDALGYDGESSDPLYKSVPFFIKFNRKTKALAGLYFPESLIEAFDFGAESAFYYSAEIAGGPSAYYLILGDDYREILHGYCSITGFPALPPLYSFGFFGSSMNYVEGDDAAGRVAAYFDEVQRRGIPCEGMYLSSGYLKAADGRRYAFIWNREKFPDPAAFVKGLADRGFRLLVNIKPGILKTHPWYGELLAKGYFLAGPDGEALTVYYWGGEASFPDFSRTEVREWWKVRLKEHYIAPGCAGIWNDNNEFEIEDPQAGAFMTRALYPGLMARAAYEAFREERPGLRPWVYSRAGYAGLQRYARTWTGDNVSDWKTLRYNQFQGLSLGLSGMPFYGHDLGGFYGPPPEEELLLRACQTGVFQGRFVIHSWREDGAPTEPWTYPAISEKIRALVLEHYRFIPYIYDCALDAHQTGVPFERLLCLEYPGDPGLPDDAPACLAGPSVLKVNAVEKGCKTVRLRLPSGFWYDPLEGSLLSGGTEAALTAPLSGCSRYLLKAGSVVPTAPGLASLGDGFYKEAIFLLTPHHGRGALDYRHFEDDGVSELSARRYSLWRITLSTEGERGNITIAKTEGAPENGGRSFVFELPPGFTFADGGRRVQVDPSALDSGPFCAGFRGKFEEST